MPYVRLERKILHSAVRLSVSSICHLDVIPQKVKLATALLPSDSGPQEPVHNEESIELEEPIITKP
jgi:hypothetical protein